MGFHGNRVKVDKMETEESGVEGERLGKLWGIPELGSVTEGWISSQDIMEHYSHRLPLFIISIRFNLPSVDFPEDVGRKSSIVTVNPSILQKR